MPHSAKPRWTVRTVTIALLVSLALHGLLFSVLWCWPARMRSPTLTIQSTRIILDACVVDSRSSTLLPERELPADLLGPNLDTTLAPRLEGIEAGQRAGSVSDGTTGETPVPPTGGTPVPATGETPVPPTGETPVPATGETPVPATGETPVPPLAVAHASGSLSAGDGLFPVPATAASVVYVLDRSVSMGIDRKLDLARRELIASLRRLPRRVRFQVVAYNDFAETLFVDGRGDLLPAEPAIVEKAVALLQALEAAGASNHFAALRCGLDLHPDVLYFLTDADNLKPEVITAITQRNQHSAIHTIELTRRRASQVDGPLAQLAGNNRGLYRRVTIGDTR